MKRFLINLLRKFKYVRLLEKKVINLLDTNKFLREAWSYELHESIKLTNENRELKEKSRDNWIPVSKRLPTEKEKSAVGGYVLGSCPAYCIPIPVYYDEARGHWMNGDGSLRIISCEAWQPLPEAYQP